MPTSTMKKKSTSRRTHANGAARRGRVQLNRELNRGVAKYALPGAAVLGAVALTGAGILMRARLAELAQTAVAEGFAATKKLSFGRVLGYAGLERQRSILSVLLPRTGALAVGILVGAALTVWLASPRRNRTDAKSEDLHSGPAPHNSGFTVPIVAANHT
jgi:hypothetical protein